MPTIPFHTAYSGLHGPVSETIYSEIFPRVITAVTETIAPVSCVNYAFARVHFIALHNNEMPNLIAIELEIRVKCIFILIIIYLGLQSERFIEEATDTMTMGKCYRTTK